MPSARGEDPLMLDARLRPGRNAQCPCGSGKKHKRCCLDGGADSLRARGSPEDPEMAVLVDTPRGQWLRFIPNAAPLPRASSQGSAAEQATHQAAATWGLPDFAYLPDVEHTGSGPKELGDMLIVFGRQGAVVQVKSREGPTADIGRERRWVTKQVDKALRQANGTIRNLQREAKPLTNLRGLTRTIDGSELAWISVVVIDHSDPPHECVPSAAISKHPCVVLLRRDWEFLFDQLKSTTAVVEYLRRVSDQEAVLGNEPMRYYGLARADHEASPEPLRTEILQGGQAVSVPLLPLAPAASQDRQDHLLFRMILEDIAVTRLTDASEDQRLMVLSELDRLQVGRRGMVGRKLRDAMQVTSQASQGETAWQLQRITGDTGSVHLGFGACSRPHGPLIARAFSIWVQLRHHDRLQTTGEGADLTTVGVLVTPRPDRVPPYDTTMCAVAGEIQLEEHVLMAYRELWPNQDGDAS